MAFAFLTTPCIKESPYAGQPVPVGTLSTSVGMPAVVFPILGRKLELLHGVLIWDTALMPLKEIFPLPIAGWIIPLGVRVASFGIRVFL